MFDLRKIFDFWKIFAVPNDFLKSKIYCTALFRNFTGLTVSTVNFRNSVSSTTAVMPEGEKHWEGQ